MRHQSHSHSARTPIDAGRQVAQLRHVLRLVEELAGRQSSPGAADAALDEGARIGAAYHEAQPIVRRRFDTLAAETAAWSADAVEALLAAGERRSPAAAARLALELDQALSGLAATLAPEPAGAIP